MKWDIIRGIAVCGGLMTIFISGIIITAIICHRLNVSHPLEGGYIVIGLLFGSPVIVAYQLFAIIMTRMTDTSGIIRTSLYAVNIIGFLIGLWLMKMLVFMIRMGPINLG